MAPSYFVQCGDQKEEAHNSLKQNVLVEGSRTRSEPFERNWASKEILWDCNAKSAVSLCIGGLSL